MEIITTGRNKAKKALSEAFIVDLEIQTDDSVIPCFHIPTGNNGQGLAPEPALDRGRSDAVCRCDSAHDYDPGRRPPPPGALALPVGQRLDRKSKGSGRALTSSPRR
jgi:hypothetical protein